MTLSVRFRHAFAGSGATLDIDFAAPASGTTMLFGPSGAGKTSVAQVVAGLLRPPGAQVDLDGQALDRLPPERRRVGVVFQDARLLPHRSVLGNLRYGLRRNPPGPIGLDEVLALLGIEALLPRRPHTLSGGERQRVAIGRALLSQPRLLVLDEPLAGLDAPRRAEILPYLARLTASRKLPILYVTHSLHEVAALADTLVLLDAGRVQAAGPVAAMLSRPDLALAARDDAGAVLAASVVSHDPARRLTRLQAGAETLWVPLLPAAVGTALRVRIPAREVVLTTEPPGAISVHNILSGRVRAVAEDAPRHAALVELALDGPAGLALLARVTPDAVSRLGLVPGAAALALVKSVAIEVLPGP